MADETIKGTRRYLKLHQGGSPPDPNKQFNATINGATATIGHVVTRVGETEPDVALAITTDGRPAGVIIEPSRLSEVLAVDPDWNIDTVLPDNTRLLCTELGSDEIVPLFLEAKAGPVPVVKGDLIALGTEAGKVRKLVYADATAATDSLIEVVGTAAEADAGSVTDDHVLLVRLNK